jgi:hypothetical protein
MTARVPSVSRSTLLAAADALLDERGVQRLAAKAVRAPRMTLDTWLDGSELWHWRVKFGRGRAGLVLSSAGGYPTPERARLAFCTLVGFSVATYLNEQDAVYWLKRASDPKFAREQAVAEFNRRMAEEGPRGPTAQRVTQRRLK